MYSALDHFFNADSLEKDIATGLAGLEWKPEFYNSKES